MIQTKSTIVIRKPIESVFNYTTNPSNAKYWYNNVKESSLISPDAPIQEGTKAKLLTYIMGKDMNFLYEIKKIVPNTFLHMVASAGAFPMESEYHFREIDDNSTEVTVITRAEPKGIPTFIINLARGKIQKTSDEDIETLRDILESK